jgi:RNA polymerase sigma-70 factor (ECF subfamily)
VGHSLEAGGVTGRERAVALGDATRAAAFTALADRHLDASYRLAHAILGDRGEAEDATHDALLQAWRHWDRLRDHDRFEAWFHRILVNTCRNRLRQSRRWRSHDLTDELPLAGPDAIGPADDRQQMGDALARLSPDHRAVLALRYYLDLPLDQVADRLGVPVGTVNSRIHYALKELRVALGEPPAEGADR